MEIEPHTLRGLLEYDPETGVLTWRHRPHGPKNFNARYAGKEAGCLLPIGYRQLSISKKGFYAHRVAWAIHHGSWPEYEIDHINGVTNDNRISNLRSVSHKENHRNQSVPKNNKSGVIGVHWNRKSRKWRAQIKIDGEQTYLGSFNCVTDAAAARAAAEIKYGYHANHGRAST
jgi:hypothetical protein